MRIKRKKAKMMNKLTDQDRRAAIDAGKQGVKGAWQKMEGRSLKWWERLVWLAVAGVVAAVSSLCSGCGAAANISLSSDQGQFFISRDSDGSLVVSAVPPVVQSMKK